MRREIKVVRADATTEVVYVYVNDLSARENLRNFIIDRRFNSVAYWDKELQAKADALISEGKGHLMYEEGMDVYLILKHTKMERAFRKVRWLLDDLDIDYEVDYRCGTPEEILRGSWYVSKLMELGYREMMCVDLKELGFLAILQDGCIMSGNNIMVMDAFRCIGTELGADDDSVISAINAGGWRIYCKDDFEEDACVICPSFEAFEEFTYAMQDK